MSDRKTPLISQQFYHIYNRGVAKQPTFIEKRDYDQAMLALSFYRFRNHLIKLSRFKEFAKDIRIKLLDDLRKSNDVNVKIISFVLMPNHFHFLLQQITENGIADFISKFTNSYTKYFNTKNDRVGPLFQGVFKSVLVEDTEQLLHLSRYIHINPVVSSVIKIDGLSNYSWSSFPDYLKDESNLIWRDPVLENFVNPKEYKQFVLDQVDYAKELELVKHLTLE